VTQDLSRLDFGAIAAEEEQHYLQHYFVPHRGYKNALSGKKTVITGPKGSGKSALRIQIKTELDNRRINASRNSDDDGVSRNLVIEIPRSEVPWGELSWPQGVGIREVDAKTNAWLAVFLYHISLTIENFTSRPYPLEDVSTVAQHLGLEQPSALRLRDVAVFFRGISARFARGEVVEKYGFDPVQRMVRETLAAVNQTLSADAVEIRLLCDQLDENWKGSEAESLTLQALFQASRFISGLGSGISVQVFVRSDIWRRLGFTDRDKLMSRVEELKWSAADLEHLLAERIRYSIRCEGTDREAIALAFGDSLFGPDGSPSQKRLLDMFEFVHYRPRDLILLCQEARDARGDIDGPLSQENLAEGFNQYSNKKLEMIAASESVGIDRHIPTVLPLLRGSTSPIIGFNLVRKIRDAGGLTEAEALTMIECLIEREVIGIRLRINERDMYYHQEPAILKRPFSKGTHYVFHQSLHKALDIVQLVASKTRKKSHRGKGLNPRFAYEESGEE
jgi:hypothetical protein